MSVYVWVFVVSVSRISDDVDNFRCRGWPFGFVVVVDDNDDCVLCVAIDDDDNVMAMMKIGWDDKNTKYDENEHVHIWYI